MIHRELYLYIECMISGQQWSLWHAYPCDQRLQWNYANSDYEGTTRDPQISHWLFELSSCDTTRKRKTRLVLRAREAFGDIQNLQCWCAPHRRFPNIRACKVSPHMEQIFLPIESIELWYWWGPHSACSVASREWGDPPEYTDGCYTGGH